MIKALEVKTSTVSNIFFAINTILLCFFFFVLIFDLDILTSAVITQIVIVATELAIPTGIPVKEAKVKMETHPATVEAKLIKSLV